MPGVRSRPGDSSMATHVRGMFQLDASIQKGVPSSPADSPCCPLTLRAHCSCSCPPVTPVPPHRKAHKKDQVTEIARKKRRVANKNAARAIVGVSLEVINKRRAEKPEVRSRTGGALLAKARSRHPSRRLEYGGVGPTLGCMSRIVSDETGASAPPAGLPLTRCRPWLLPVPLPACRLSVDSRQQFRQANRDKAIREVKERAKKVKAEKAKASKGPAAKAAPAAKVVGRGKR